MKGDSSNRKYIIWFWTLFIIPFITVLIIFILISNGKLGPMPSFRELENPEYNLAAEVYSEDGVLLGKISIENRTWTDYDDLSSYLVNALIATEDIRYYRHSGIDIRGLGRAIVRTIVLGQKTGGGSTITQQLAKQLYPRDTAHVSAFTRKLRLGVSKFKEWQTAVKLEKSYTKEEIIAMYLNKYDFLYQAIGIRSAARVYFNTTPDSLKIEQAAVLVGMLKNSSAYNPRKYPERMLQRRNTVLSQMAKYGYIHPDVADSVRQLPITLDFRLEDHNTGRATYLREYLRNTMRKPEPVRDRYERESSYEDARWEWDNNPLYGWCNKNTKEDGSNYNLYTDGLKIYTTIDSHMQKYAEEAVYEHIGGYLQDLFFKEKKGRNYAPYTKNLSQEQVMDILYKNMKQSERYRSMKNAGFSESKIRETFNKPVEMSVFTYSGMKDTIMSPLDSIRYHKYFLRAGFMSMDPMNGHVMAYVGGVSFIPFQYDMVMTGRRQIGSTIKPFLYSMAMEEGMSPCDKTKNGG